VYKDTDLFGYGSITIVVLSVKKNCVHQSGPTREKIDEKGKKSI
jgi:hypothetical protein